MWGFDELPPARLAPLVGAGRGTNDKIIFLKSSGYLQV